MPRFPSIAGALGRRPVLVFVLLSWLGFPVLALASGAPAWFVELSRVLIVPAYVSGLGLFLLTRGILGPLTWPLALLATVMIAVAVDRYLRSWSSRSGRGAVPEGRIA